MARATPCDDCGMTMAGPCSHPRCPKRKEATAVDLSQLIAENERLKAARVQETREIAARGEACIWMSDGEDPMTVTIYGIRSDETRRRIVKMMSDLDKELCSENKAAQ